MLPAAFPWWGLLALATAAFTDVMTDLLPAGLLPQMSGALHVPGARIGLLVSAFALASSLAAIPVTAALRGLPRRPVLTGALAGFALFDGLTAMSPWYLLTFLARLAAGVMGGTLWSLLAGYAARMVPARQRGRAIAVVLAGITVALCGGLPAGTALASLLGWRAGFALLAGLALLVTAWIRWQVPAFPGESAARRPPLRQVTARPGVPAVLAVTLLLLTGHQALYTYIAPFAQRSGFGRTSLVLLIFGAATVAGVWVTGLLADRYLRTMLLGALGLIATAMLVLSLAARQPTALLAAVALWGAAFGGAPALLQTALVDAAGPAAADVATAAQTTVYNVGIAAGSLVGGLVPDAAALPWVTLAFTVTALSTVATARRHAFPGSALAAVDSFSWWPGSTWWEVRPARRVGLPHMYAEKKGRPPMSIPATMRALQQASLNGPRDMSLITDAPVPSPGQGEVLIRVTAAGVNFADISRAHGTFLNGPRPPYVAGFEAAGEIVATGEEVTGLQLGARVIGVGDGAFAEYMVLPAAAAMPVPPGWTEQQALGLVVNWPTALAILKPLGGITAGQTVLIHAAAGATGQAAVTIAKHYGATVIATASPGKHKTVLALGADHVLDSRGGDIAAEVLRLTGGVGVDVVLEATPGATFEASLAATKRVTGRVVVHGVASGDASITTWELVYKHQVHIIGFNAGALIQAAPQIFGEVMGELSTLIAIGVLAPGRPTEYDLADGPKALADLETRATIGKLALLT